MAESKRIFNQGKQNRDIDARLLPPGQYRDALNVNVGESEGGDIGALENLKGNSIIAGQDAIQGTTIGSISDPNNDRVYWFTTSDTVDGVYEYDMNTGTVSTLVRDIKRDVPLPSCAPDVTVSSISPDSITPDRPDLNFPAFPDPPPVPGCTNPAATNFNPLATQDDGSCITGPPPPTSDWGIGISANPGLFVTPGTAVTLTASAVQGVGTGLMFTAPVNIVWSDGASTSGAGSVSLPVPGQADGTSLSFTATGTDNGGLVASNARTITWTSAPPVNFNLNVSSSTSIANTTATGSISTTGSDQAPISVNQSFGVAASSGFQIDSATAILTPAIAGLTLSQNGNTATLSGTYSGPGDATATVNWTGSSSAAAVTPTLTITDFGPGANENQFRQNGTNVRIFLNATLSVGAPGTNPGIRISASYQGVFGTPQGPISSGSYESSFTVGATSLPNLDGTITNNNNVLAGAAVILVTITGAEYATDRFAGNYVPMSVAGVTSQTLTAI